MQFARLIRRNREYDQWSLTKKDQRNGMVYWGTLIGLTDIKPPLRLSPPYLSIYGENQTSLGENGQRTHDNSYSYSGGADLKYRDRRALHPRPDPASRLFAGTKRQQDQEHRRFRSHLR